MKVAFAGTFAVRMADRVRAHLAVPCEIVLAGEAEVVAHLPEVDVLVTLAFDKDMGAAGRRLKLVQVPGAGLDRIDRAAVPRGAALANAYGHETGIAEYVLGAMLALNRSFGRLDAALRHGVWESQWAVNTPPPPVWPELAGSTLGVLGYGRIGQRVARLARAFDMAVCGIGRKAAPVDHRDLAFFGAPDDLAEVLRRSDYLAITLPLTPATRGLLGRRELGLMKPSAFLVNVARAEIVDENALYEALAGKTIAGAALDVWYRYPSAAAPTLPSRHAFHELPNVLMTPHVAGWTEGTLEARAKLIADNIGRAARGELPVNLIEPSA